MTRQRMTWFAAPVRRAAGVEQWARRMGVGIHPALMLEGRGAANAVAAMYTQHALAADTGVVVVPSTSVVTASGLSRFGVPSAADYRDAHSSRGEGLDGPIAAILQCSSRSAWVELAWRLAMDMINPRSRWWGWHGLLPTNAAIGAFCGDAARATFMSGPHAHAFPSWLRLSSMINEDMENAHAWISTKSRNMMVPPVALFKRASWICVQRARWLPNIYDAASLPPQLGIVPIADLATTVSPTASRGVLGNDAIAPADYDLVEAWEETPAWYRDGGVDDSVFDTLPDHILEADKRRQLLSQEADRWQLLSQRGLATYWLVLTTRDDVAVASRIVAPYDALPQPEDEVEAAIVRYAVSGSPRC